MGGMMKYIAAIFMLLILVVGCAPTAQDVATQTSPPKQSITEPTTTQTKQSTRPNITPTISYKPRSTVPVLPDDFYCKVYLGYPPFGKYPAAKISSWVDNSFRSSPGNGLIYLASTDIKPLHYGLYSGGIINIWEIYYNFGIKLLSAGDYILADDYFNHNLPYTLWSEREGWYIPAGEPSKFGGLLLYLSKHPPFDVNYDKPPQPYYRWYEITEADIQEWRIQELESQVEHLQNQQQYR